MRHSLLTLLLFCHFAALCATSPESLGQVLERLDSVMARSDEFVQQRTRRIDDLRRKLSETSGDEERYWVNRSLYDETMVFDSDSAMAYARRNLRMANAEGNRERIAEWRIKYGFILAATGLLKEAFDEMQAVDPHELPASMRADYFENLAYLYSHMWQYDHSSVYARDYLGKSRAFEDSILTNILPTHPMYLWYKSWRAQNNNDRRPYINKLRPVVEKSDLTTRADAMMAYSLATLYQANEMTDSAVYFFAKAAIADISSATRDIASLHDLAAALFRQGDINRAYNYTNFGLNQSMIYNNRVRAAEYSRLENQIGQVYQNHLGEQARRLSATAWLIGILALILTGLTVALVLRIRKLHQMRRELSAVNTRLADHIRQLSAAREELTRANEELVQAHDQAIAANRALGEANFVKEQCISSMFNLCSMYIDKLESFRKEVNRKLLAHQTDDLQRLTATPARIKNELKDFFNNFDRIVLDIYPRFIDEFNSLLRPDEAITPRDGELLNTTLRIYALVRLGIDDSVKIAAMLHCSPQTVYNKRMATRNKARIPREEFAAAVRDLDCSAERTTQPS